MSEFKKNILLLTPIYPGPGIIKEYTPIVHYFAKEWVEMGYNVIVINNMAYYSRLFYIVSSVFSKFLANIIGTIIPTKPIKNSKTYEMDGVNVLLLPMFKAIPRHRFSSKIIIKQIEHISYFLNSNSFIPDYIIGHWGSQLELVTLMKMQYPESKTGLIIHNGSEGLLKAYGNQTIELIRRIDIIGFRSIALKANFVSNFGEPENSFICYSGVSKEFLHSSIPKEFPNKVLSFVFVGVLIKRKYPSNIIHSISSALPNDNINITFVGEGPERKRIETLAKKFGINKHVIVTGKINRSEVKKTLDLSDCFIMISKDEAFGLVYLEAMSTGCITIASRNEGMDGIIEHGVNGFLCNAGDSNELRDLIIQINSLSIAELKQISMNAINTAKCFSDELVAKHYINSFNC